MIVLGKYSTFTMYKRKIMEYLLYLVIRKQLNNFISLLLNINLFNELTNFLKYFNYLIKYREFLFLTIYDSIGQL